MLVGVGQKDANLAIGDFACRSGVLGGYPNGLGAFLDKAGLIDHQHCFWVGQVRQDILLQVVTYPVGIPMRCVEQTLHPVWRPFSRQFRQLPSVFALGDAQQTTEIGHGPLTGLGTFKVRG